MNFNFTELFNPRPEILDYKIGGNALFQYLIALGVFLLSIFILRIFKRVVIRKLKKLAKRTSVKFDDILIAMIDAVGWPFYMLLSLYVSFRFVILPQVVDKYFLTVILIISLYYIVKAIQVLIDYWTQKLAIEKEETLEIDSSSAKLLRRILKGILWAIAIILVLQNLGYNISTLMAGLGIGGVAVAFALQNILGDIFASFSIHFDRPFQVGDFIIVGEEKGTVKSIGIKSTRIQSLQGEELIISNRELTEARIHNFKRMDKRRIVFQLGVAYETPTEKLKKIPDIIRKIADKIDFVEINRVYFKEFADFSLNFEVVYFLNSTDFDVYVKVREQINLAIKEAFEKEGIEMAYPTQTVFVKK
jgi:small-conductance mechanosensitive channel